MSVRDELEKKRQERLSQQNAGTLSEARLERIAKMESGKSSFLEAPKPSINTSTDVSTAGDAFKRSAAVNVLPTLGGVLTGAKAGAIAGTLGAGPIGTVLGFIGGGITGAVLTKKAQDEVLNVVKGEEWKRNLDQSIAEDRKNHPYVTLIGESAPQLITFKPSPTTLKQAFDLSKRILSDPKSVSKHTSTLQGKTELDALINVGIGSGVDVSLETYQQVREGDVNALRILGSALIGGAISDPNRIGLKLGFKATGDAVIEEYNQFGSKTPAAKIVTHGEIPMLDRSVDPILLQRKELASILRGEAEKNRFDNPRILQAERIAGTIDKDITPDSNINVYRLDGRSGGLKIGERVTANPHIADVYGGKVRPETTLRAGDLVRTSQGDYVYVPKEAIVARPKLPPIATSVEKNVREQVTIREKLEIKAQKARAREAVRIKEEPARLQKEAELKAVKEQEEAEKVVAKQKEDRARLEQEIKNLKTKEEADLTAEKIRVANEIKKVNKEREILKKKLSKEIELAGVTLRKNLSGAKIKHVKRKQGLKTPIQKAKEDIRYKNEVATLRAKTQKQKKSLREEFNKKSGSIKGDTKDGSSEIKKQARAGVIRVKKEISSIKIKKELTPSPKEAPTAKKEKVQKQPVSKVKQTIAQKQPAPGEKTTLIGSKSVESKSIIKNAIEDARSYSEKAQYLDENVTSQEGTTFVEQRKLSAELIVRKGLDDTLKFAREASDTELNKMGIDRSALYSVLVDTINKSGQFSKYRDELESLALLVSDDVSIAAQKSSLHRMAVQNDPFRVEARIKKALLDKEKKARGSVFEKEVEELRAKIKDATSEEDLNKIINDNLC